MSNSTASTNSINIVPVQGVFDASGNCIALVGPGGEYFYPPLPSTIQAQYIYATVEIGYNGGNFGTVTQANNKSTAVTINTASGQIITASSQLAPSAQAYFTVNCSAVSADDNVICSIASGGTLGAYNVFIAGISNGSFTVVIKNSTNNAYSESVTLNYSILHTAS